MFDLQFFKNANQVMSKSKTLHQTFSEEFMSKFPKWSKAYFPVTVF